MANFQRPTNANRIAVKIIRRRNRLADLRKQYNKTGNFSQKQKAEAMKLIEDNRNSMSALKVMGLDPNAIIREVEETYAGESGIKKKLSKERAVGMYSLGSSPKFWKT